MANEEGRCVEGRKEERTVEERGLGLGTGLLKATNTNQQKTWAEFKQPLQELQHCQKGKKVLRS